MPSSPSQPSDGRAGDPTHAVLVLLRHGESVWNRSKRLTGWTDVPLTERGRTQARHAGERLRAQGVVIDTCFSSRLVRATETRDLVLAALGQSPRLQASWRLNERHYGALQGLLPWQAVWRFGLGPVLRCRRDFDARPPLVAAGSGDLHRDPTVPLADEPEWSRTIRGESLADTLQRVLPLWESEIAPALRARERVLIVAHNNLLRALVLHLEGARPHQLPRLRTAQPWIFALDADLQPLRHYLL